MKWANQDEGNSENTEAPRGFWGTWPKSCGTLQFIVLGNMPHIRRGFWGTEEHFTESKRVDTHLVLGYRGT